MGYFDEIIKRDETVLFRGHISNAIYILPIVWTIATLFIGLPISIAWIALTVLYQRNSALVVTDKRILAKYGLFGDKFFEQRLNRIESVTVDPEIMLSITEHGRVTISNTGLPPFVFEPIAKPEAFKQAVEQGMEQYESQLKAYA